MSDDHEEAKKRVMRETDAIELRIKMAMLVGLWRSEAGKHNPTDDAAWAFRRCADMLERVLEQSYADSAKLYDA